MAKKQKKKTFRAPTPNETPDYTDPRQLASMVRRTARENVERTRQMERNYHGVSLQMDMEPVRVKRRSEALIRTMPQVRRLAEPLCPDLPNLYSIEEDWVYANTLSLGSYDELEGDLYLIHAAAIWMLDHIKQNGRIRDAVALLPRDDALWENANIVSLYDPVHDEEVITGMVCAIEHRNADCELPGQKRSSRKAQEKEGRTLSDLATAMQIHHQDVPSRRRFEALLEMIPKEDIARAAQTFEEKLFEMVERYFRCRATLCKREQDIAAQMDGFYRRMTERAQSMMERSQKQPDPLQVFAQSPRSGSADVLNQLMTDPAELYNWFEEEAKRLDQEMDGVKLDAIKLAYHFRRLITPFSAEEHHQISAEAAEIVSDFQPADPYEMSFALLYLLDTDSDLPWLYLPGTAMAYCAGRMLPWYHTEFEEFEDWHWAQYHGSDPAAARPSVSKPSELPDWYQVRYEDHTADPEERIHVNLAQVFYEATGCIPPRDLHRYDDALSLMKQYGINGKKLQIPLLYAMLFAGESRYQSCLPYVGSDLAENLIPAVMERIQSEVMPELMETLDNHADTSRQAEIDALKQENERLKRRAYEADREARNLRRDYESLLQDSQRERQELAELREILFCQENEQEPELDEAEEAVSIPYTVRHTTVVFGGHDSWARAIKPMLEGDIRFIDRGMQPEASLIRHAEMVWLQPNSIRHAFFYKIIKIIRTYHIPFHYFKFASAEKCARQLAGVDQF